MKNLKKKKEFIDALKLMEDEIIHEIDSQPDEQYEPSEKINTTIEKIIFDMQEKDKKKAYRHKVSIVAATMTVILILCLGCAPAVRKTIINVYDKFIELIAGNNAKTEITELYEPTWLPDGYELESVQSNMPTRKTIIWKNNECDIVFEQSTSSFSSLDNENSQYNTYQINDLDIHYSFKYNTYNMVWYYNDYLFNLSCSDSIKFDDIIRIIDSIEMKQ